MTPSQVAWEFEKGIETVNLMDFPSSIFVLLVILVFAFVGALFIGAIYKIINYFLRIKGGS